MALRAKVLQKKAEKFERKKLQFLQVTKEQVSALEPLLQDVYVNRRPKPTDYEVRRDLVRVFNEIAKEIYGNSKDIPVVVEFGSFVMDLFSSNSDLDLSVNFSPTAVTCPREKKIQTLRKFAKKLYAIQSKGHVCGVLPITTAKVPILKCVDRGTGVECDISVENRDGILKSQIIHLISSIDQRFQKLSFLMKTWAKAHNINSSKDKTLNSLSIILLVAFHLQTRDPPILPPFSAIFKDGTDPAMLVKSLSNFANYGKRNTESLAELFVTLLIKLSSVEKLWPKGLCASTCKASWTSKTWDSKVACVGVEDFTDPSQNVARAVGPGEVKQIYKCIGISIHHIFSFMDGQIGVQLGDLLFGHDGNRRQITGGAFNMYPVATLPYIPSQASQTRRVNGKRKKQAMRHDSVPTNGILPVESYARAQTGSQEQVEQAMVLESVSAKKMRVNEGCRETPGRSWGAALVGDQVGTQQSIPFDATKRVQPMGGWAGVLARDSGETHRTTLGGWGGSEQPGTGGWGGTQRASVEGWEAIPQPSARGWGGSLQRSTGARGEAQQLSMRGWGGSQLPSAGGWGGAGQPSAGGWVGSQQHSSGGWGGTQPHIAGGWDGTSNTSRRKLVI